MAKPAPMPDCLLIGTITYTVKADDDAWVRIEHSLQRKGDYGHTTHTDALIFINPGCSPDVARLTLWHETLHCLAEVVMGSPGWDNLGENHDEREEFVIRAWGHATLAVLRDNPDLVAYLTAAAA